MGGGLAGAGAIYRSWETREEIAISDWCAVLPRDVAPTYLSHFSLTDQRLAFLKITWAQGWVHASTPWVFFGQIISLFQSPPMELHGCLWRTREIISFHLYNYTLSWNKSIFANDVISRFVPTGSQALTKPLSCRQESYPVGCRAKMELSEDVIHFIYF